MPSPALAQPGSYLLVICTESRLELPVGRLGQRAFPSGWHVYAGSALRGLSARLRHHLSPNRAVRWHVDYLHQAGRLAQVWVVPGAERRECALARALASLPGGQLCPGFGSSDCRCPGHLVSFPASPRLDELWPGLEQVALGDAEREDRT
ncbi:MAG: GIY-YIG nuclease family protein [Chloroflexi bacterium]|nr:GIY-YIG nuclease family protein [Chloroflexota bacterium]